MNISHCPDGTTMPRMLAKVTQMSCSNFTLQIAQGGRVVIPAKARQALGLSEGVRVTLEVYKDRLTIVPLDRALDVMLTKARSLLQGPSLADELIAERRREAERE